MEHRISHRNMDELLKGLEDDYVEAVKAMKLKAWGSSSNNFHTIPGIITIKI